MAALKEILNYGTKEDLMEAMRVFGLSDCSKVMPDRIIGVIMTLEFLQHHFA